MTAQFTEAFNDLIREKRIDKKILMDTLEAGFTSAVKKKLGAAAEVEVAEDGRGNIELYLLKTVVETVESPVSEISLEEASEYDEETKVGDQVKIYMPFTDFGRNAIQIAKQILTQKIREFERDRTFEEYKNRVGEIVSGSVQQIDRNGILVNLGNAEATMPKKEQIRRERYTQGSSIRACITKVDKEAKGPMITVSRTSPEFLKKLFAQEVPEIYEGIIEVKSVAREAGGRSKIAVYSRDDRVDAVGACVGMKGSRVQAVVKESISSHGTTMFRRSSPARSLPRRSRMFAWTRKTGPFWSSSRKISCRSPSARRARTSASPRSSQAGKSTLRRRGSSSSASASRSTSRCRSKRWSA
jgi:N utilization substance protein A